MWLPVLATAALHLALLATYVAAFRGDISALVCAREDWIGHAPFQAVHTGLGGDRGFDGQFYYVIAQNPWQPHRDYMDRPTYRHIRILYPALCWLLSAGNAVRLLWVMPLLNLAAITGLAW